MKNFLKIFVIIWLITLSAGVGYAVTHKNTVNQAFGATSNAGANALFEQSLAQPLGTTDTNMYLTSGADVQSNLLPLNSYQCLSVDTGQPNFEAICGTVTTTSTTGLTLLISLRGLSTQTATTSNSSFIFTHRRGADVRITDFPTLTVLNNQLSGTQVIPGKIYYDPSVTISALDPNDTIPNKAYVDGVVVTGCSNANATTKGCVQLATALQAASTTVTGSTGALLVIPSSIATDTPQSGCSAGFLGVAGAGCNVMANLKGKLTQSWLDLTQAFTWTGIQTFAASSTFNATTTIAASSTIANALRLNGINYAFPSLQISSTTALETNGSGQLTWEIPQASIVTINNSVNAAFDTSSTTIATLVIPANTLSNNKKLNIDSLVYEFNGGICAYEVKFGNGTATTTVAVGQPNDPGGFAGSQSQLNIYGTGASSQNIFSFNTDSSSGVSTNFASSSQTSFNNAAPLYISYDGKTGGNSCNLMGWTITLYSN